MASKTKASSPKQPVQPALSFRVPRDLFLAVKTRAVSEGRSVSNYVTRLLRATVGLPDKAAK